MSSVGTCRYKVFMEVDDDVRRFVDAVTPERRRRDAREGREGGAA
jgi:hypothetical protein